MAIKTYINYSPNFSAFKRTKKHIKFLIFHYTGMKTELEAINRLTKIQSEVSSHYLIKSNGDIINLVPDLYIAWHAGISCWKNYNSLNKNSIGIEIVNPGHRFGYKNFSKKQINSLLKLSKFLIKKYKISSKNILGHSDIAPERKKDPGEKFPWKLIAKNSVGIWHKLSAAELKRNRMITISEVEKKNFLNYLHKIGYSKKTPPLFNKNLYTAFVIKAFQRRFRQELVNGKTDKECLLIASHLYKKYH